MYSIVYIFTTTVSIQINLIPSQFLFRIDHASFVLNYCYFLLSKQLICPWNNWNNNVKLFMCPKKADIWTYIYFLVTISKKWSQRFTFTSNNLSFHYLNVPSFVPAICNNSIFMVLTINSKACHGCTIKYFLLT